MLGTAKLSIGSVGEVRPNDVVLLSVLKDGTNITYLIHGAESFLRS